MKLDIIYEDNHIIVAIKPAGILSQEDHTGDDDMLSLLKEYIKVKYNKPGNVYLGLVMRLDRMTSGVMVFAKTSKAASRLSLQIRNHEVIKKYLAVVEGDIVDNGTLENYLIKDENQVKSFVDNKGKKASLDFEKLAYKNNLSLIKVNLHTGRHHQIRVQFAHFGFPLYSDRLYGASGNDVMHLHAYYLSFVHPVTKEKMEFVKMPTGKLWSDFELSKIEL